MHFLLDRSVAADGSLVATAGAFVVLALAIFLVVRAVSHKKRSERAAADVLSQSQDALSLSELPISFAKVDGYRLVEKYYETATTISYLAKDETGYVFMVVLPAPRLFKDDEFLQRFAREGEALGKLRHHGIANLQKSGIIQGKGQKIPYLVLEFLEGQTLAEYMAQNGPLPVPHAVRMLASLAGALQAIHGQGLIHRNVRADSIRVNSSGEVKLLNPMLAPTGDLQKMTQVGHAVAGDAQYISPEQMMGGAESVQTDLYALGVVAFQVLTGKFPYDTGNVAMLAVKKVNEDPLDLAPLRPDVPAPLVEVVSRLISREQAHRYPDTNLLVQAVASLQQQA